MIKLSRLIPSIVHQDIDPTLRCSRICCTIGIHLTGGRRNVCLQAIGFSGHLFP
jgi:hypothetical protein